MVPESNSVKRKTRKEKTKSLKIFYNNINGYQSKKESFTKIIQSNTPDIITLCETKRGENIRVKKDEIPGYDVVEKNEKNGKEGLLIAVRKGTYSSMSEVSETEMKNIMTVQIKFPNLTMRVILVHAPQETVKYDQRLDFFNEVAEQIERCITSGDILVVVGDMNARIEKSSGITAMSSNGKLLKTIIDDNELRVANFHEKTEGMWTRIQSRKDGSQCKSVLDYCLIEEETYTQITSMLIDEEKVFCPYREKIVRNNKEIIFSDHCALMITLELNVGKHHPKILDNRKVWSFTKEGFAAYEEMSKNKLTVRGALDPTAVYDSWNSEFENLLHSCFEKKTVKTRNSAPIPNKKFRHIRGILAAMSKKGKIQRMVSRKYLKMVIVVECRQAANKRAERLKKTMENLSEKEKFSPAGYWRMKKAADKNTSKREEMSSIKLENGVEVEGDAAIMEAYVQEFRHRLRNRKPADGWEEYVEETNNKIRTWLDGNCKDSPPFTMKELKAVVKRLKRGKAPGVDKYPAELFLLAGQGVLESILELFNWIKECGYTPEQWDVMKIVTIYKKKGSKKMLKHYRGIFLALKLFEGMVKGRISDNLVDVHILQAGAKSNRSPADNVFLMRAVADHHKHTKKPLYVTAYDYEQAFDSLWVEDCILSLAKLEVSKEMLKLIYSLNKKAIVTVQTPFGETRAFETDPIVKQGTVLGSVLCSSSTAEYCGENVGVKMGDTSISSLLFVDDIIDLSDSLEECIKAHAKALSFSKRKKLTLSGTKCYMSLKPPQAVN